MKKHDLLKELSLKDLRLVQLINDGSSITAAARQMHVSQPAASQRLAQLQERIGAELFLRKDGSLQATAMSKRLADACKAIDKELECTRYDIEALINPGTPQLRVATQCYTSYRWLPFVLREMHREFPHLEIDVLPEATENPYQALAEQRIDVALVFHPQSGFSVVEQELFGDELYAVMNNEHALANRHYLNPANFENETLVLYTGDKHAIIEEKLKPAGIKPARLMQVRMTEAIVELVRAGHGIAVLSGWAFDDIDNKQKLRAVRISKPGFTRQWRAVTAEATDMGNSKHLQRFIYYLKQVGQVIHQQNWRRVISKKGSLSA